MKIKLAQEEIEIRLDHKRIYEIEKQVGSIYGYPEKCVNKTVTFSDVIAIYYNGQDNTSYSESQLFDKIAQDGLTLHISNTYEIVMELVVGKEAFAKVIKEADKETKDPIKKN